MIRTRVIPCLLLKGAGLVKTVKFQKPTYIGDPINAVRIFNEKECHELVFLDITATLEGRKPRMEMIADIAGECFMPFAYGGGISDLEDARKILALGVEKIVVNSHAVENPAFITEAARLFGSQSVVVCIDVKKNFWGKYEVFTQAGQKNAKKNPVQWAQEVMQLGAGEIIVNSIDQDGTMQGYDLKLIQSITAAVDIPVVALGGAGSVQDLGRAVSEGGAAAVAAGSFFVYYGKHRAVLISFPSDKELSQVLP